MKKLKIKVVKKIRESERQTTFRFLATFFFIKPICGYVVYMAADDISKAATAVVLVSNVPPHFGTADLRRFFTAFVEAGKFSCFHFKRRPVEKLPDHILQKIGPISSQNRTNCGLAQLKDFSEIDDFVRRYNGSHWLGANEEELETKCRVTTVLPMDSSLSSLMEFRPPRNLMPSGNVGTTTSFFMAAIRECRMPSKLIGKLGLGRVPGRKYSQVRPLQVDEEDEAEEEWERHQALHLDTTSARRVLHRPEDHWHQPGTKEKLFEEDMEVTWEKGGSGLVFYTDAQFWHSFKSDEERNCDDWDVDMSVYDGGDGGGDRDAIEMRQMRQERKLRKGSSVRSAFFEVSKEGRSVTVKEYLERSRRNHPAGPNLPSQKEPVDGGDRQPGAKTLHLSFVKGPLLLDPSIRLVNPGESEDSKVKSHVKKSSSSSDEYLGNSYSRYLMEKLGWKKGQGLGSDSRGRVEPVLAVANFGKAGLGYNR